MVEPDGDVADVFFVLSEERVGESDAFVAEDEIVAGGVFHLEKVLCSAGAEKPFCPVGVVLEEGLKVGPDVQFNRFPVIESGAAESSFREVEAQRFDQMQDRSGGGAEARNISGVRRNGGLD